MPRFSSKSNKLLATVHPDLHRIFYEVVKGFDCTILEGGRTPERQAELVAQGKSKTKHSKHIDGLAIDVAPYPIDWKDRERFHYFGGYVLGVASRMGIKLRWGGDWDMDTQVKNNNFDDLVHFELV